MAPKPRASSGTSFVPLGRLAKAAPDPETALATIRRIYFRTTRETIEHDLAEALDLLKGLPDEETRERATVFMHGLNEMRREWSASPRSTGRGAVRARAAGTSGKPPRGTTSAGRSRKGRP